MSKPRLSILMSVYNEPDYQIKESVESLLCQTFSDFELIVVNDNPNRKDVESIIGNYHDNRIRFYHNEKNIGLAMSMNKAASLACADFFARMDADDIADVQRIEKEIEALAKGYDIVFSHYSFIDEMSHELTGRKAPQYSNENISRKISLDPSIIHHPTTLFTKAIFDKVGGYRDFPCSQDADLWMRMAEAGAQFYYISDNLLRYRINSQSVSNKRWYKQQLTCNYIFDLSLERLQKGEDSYNLDSYTRYLQKWGVENPNAELRLRNCYSLLSKSATLAANGKRIASLILRIRVFLSSSLMRNHYLALKKKERILNRKNG